MTESFYDADSKLTPQSVSSDYKASRGGQKKTLDRVARSVNALTLCSALSLLLPQVAHPQTLNQVTQDLLANNCAGLGVVPFNFLDFGQPPGGEMGPVGPADVPPTFPPIVTFQETATSVQIPGLGPQLSKICLNSTSTTFPTGGGAGATPQTSYVSVRNSTVLSRLETARAKIDEPTMPMMPPVGKPMPRVDLGNGLTLSFLGDLMSVNTPSAASQSGSDSGTVNLVASGGNLLPGLGLFASGLIEGLDRDVTTFQEGYDSTIFGFTAGGDYYFTDKLVAGLAFTYTDLNADFTGGGDFHAKSYEPTLFASFLPTQETFIQVVGAYTRNSFTVNRLASYLQANGTPITMGTASSDSYGNVWSLAALAGYDLAIRNVTLGPRLGLNWSNVQLQEYAETGTTGLELAYNEQWVNSLQSVVGLYASAAYSTTVAVFVPQVTADYIHEFANSQRLVEAQFVQDLRANPTRFNFQNETPVRNFFNLSIGLSAIFPHGIQPYANFRAMVGNEQFNNYAGILGLRLEIEKGVGSL